MGIQGLDLAVLASDRVEWLVADVSLARALFGGVPVARLLARTRLASDERDLTTSPLGNSPATSTWDLLMKRLLGKHAATFDRVKRQVARHTRAASDEGPLPVADAVVAVLVHALAASMDVDASLAEVVAGGPSERAGAVDISVARAVGAYDPRLARSSGDARAPLFEACIRLATRAASGPSPLDRVNEAQRLLHASELRLELLRPSNVSLYPRDFEPPLAPGDRRMALLERAELDILLARDPRELAAIVARVEEDKRGLDSLLADLGKLLKNPGELVLAIPPMDPQSEEETTTFGPPSSLPSWLPTEWGSREAGSSLAEAFERGAMTLPRLRSAVTRGGEEALDAIGAEMLAVTVHPFASAAFAELLARSGRSRDVVRLVTYFALAPDPALAARALATCPAPELPALLRDWLEAMLPPDGGPAPPGGDPQTSSAARLIACLASLAPYPHLYRVVQPLTARLNQGQTSPIS